MTSQEQRIVDEMAARLLEPWRPPESWYVLTKKAKGYTRLRARILVNETDFREYYQYLSTGMTYPMPPSAPYLTGMLLFHGTEVHPGPAVEFGGGVLEVLL